MKRRCRAVYNTYIEENLRYSQNAALDMYKEVNTGSNLPAQIDLYSVDGEEYKFCASPGWRFRQQNLSVSGNQGAAVAGQTEKTTVDKMRTLGTAACPPYHVAFVIGGTSAEATLKTVKLASTSITMACRPKATSMAGVPRSGTRSGTAARSAEHGSGRAVRRQILRARYSRGAPAAPRRVLPGRHGRLVLGGPQHQR